MIDLRSATLLHGLPRILREDPDVQALSAAFAWLWGQLWNEMAAVGCTVDLEAAPEAVLDELAVEWRTPNYDQRFDMATKRELLRATLPWWTSAGTVAATQRAMEQLFGNAEIVEWFDYDGKPHYFQIHVKGAEATSRHTSEVRTALDQVKRLSSWLDAVVLEFDPMEALARFGGYLASIMTTPLAELPDEFRFEDVLHLGGNLTTVMLSPVPEQPDALQFDETVQIGGGFNTVQTTPLPAI